MEQRKILLDYVISHAANDQRPYLQISVLGISLLALLDSGASRTVVGNTGYQKLLKLGLTLNSTNFSCTVANGQSCKVIGFIQTPVKLMDRVRLIDILVVPELPHLCILGIDFWLSMDLIPNLREDVWRFGDNPTQAITCIEDESTLTPEQKLRLDKLIESYPSVMKSDSLGKTTAIEHDIILEPGTKPIKQRYYPVSPFKQKIINEELEKMLALEVIEPSKSAWSSPVCLIPKKDGSYRFCIDFRQLNAVTKKDAYPLPYISSILDNLREAKYISTLDIKSAYWQVPLAEGCREYTAFTVPGRGLFHFRRMAFGLTNAPATFQRLVDQVLGIDLQPYVYIYLDDIVIANRDFETHLKTVSLVFERLRNAGLTLSESKCYFCKPTLRYLGFLVDRHGLRPDPEKVQGIINTPPPDNVAAVRRFIGMASWYRKFIPDFATIAAPLTQLTKKNARFVWTPDHAEAFRKLKEFLITTPILSPPDFTKTFTLQTDASAYGIGAVLTQEFEDGERVICYLSRSLTNQERKYTTTERECLSVIWSVEKLRHYLEGVHFKVITDHYSLLWLSRLKDPQGRLARWALRLQPYDFELIHRKGKDHIVPDCLSRAVPISLDTVEPADAETPLETTDRWFIALRERIEKSPDKYPQFRIGNGKVFKYRKCQIPELTSETDYWKEVVPKDRRERLIKTFHDDPASGHVGVYKTLRRICQRFTWPKMAADIQRYIKSCKVCAQQKIEARKPAGLMGTYPKVTSPWQVISLDYIGPLPRSIHGNTHVLVVSDYFSKYVVLFPIRSATAKSLVKNIEEGIFLVYGVPEYILCDNGVQFRSREFQKLCDKYKTRIRFTALYHPCANPTERVNRVVKTMISSYIQDDQRHWDDNLASIACAIRTAEHETIGFSPYFVNFGREHKLSGEEHQHPLQDSENQPIEEEVNRRQRGFQEMFKKIQSRLQAAHEKNKRHFDLRRRPVDYEVGDKVWRKNKSLSDAVLYYSSKLAPKYIGPFTIRKKVGYYTYQLEDKYGSLSGIWHAQDLKSYFEPP